MNATLGCAAATGVSRRDYGKLAWVKRPARQVAKRFPTSPRLPASLWLPSFPCSQESFPRSVSASFQSRNCCRKSLATPGGGSSNSNRLSLLLFSKVQNMIASTGLFWRVRIGSIHLDRKRWSADLCMRIEWSAKHTTVIVIRSYCWSLV